MTNSCELLTTIFSDVIFIVCQLTPSEADRYKDVVGLEYATMAQQNFLPPREQRAIYQQQVEIVRDISYIWHY